MLFVISVWNPKFPKEFESERPENITDKLYSNAKDYYKRKSQTVLNKVYPLVKDLYTSRGETLENVIVPFTDGRKGLNVMVNLVKANESNGDEINIAIERMISLIVIDDHWKDHLRNMDDLKQSYKMLLTNKRIRF